MLRTALDAFIDTVGPWCAVLLHIMPALVFATAFVALAVLAVLPSVAAMKYLFF